MVHIDVRGGPGDLGWSPGSESAGNAGKTGLKISGQTSFMYPAQTTSFPERHNEGPGAVFPCTFGELYSAAFCTAAARSQATVCMSICKCESGHLKVIWPEIFGSGFLGFASESDPGDPLDRRGPPRRSICIKTQPRKTTLRPNGDEPKVRQTAFR